MEFFDYFSNLFGDRWPTLLESLKGEGKAMELRLSHVLENSLPAEWRQIVSVTGYDGVKFGMHRKETYDRILLDAPCSSDRHVLNSPEHLKVWSAKRVKRLAVEQGSLLASAVDALKPGGTVVYSTCALSPLENDDVVKKILKKRPSMRLQTIAEIPAGADRTECGVHILPDRAEGRGPIYCARLVKS